MFTGDRLPDWVIDLSTGNAADDLTPATWRFVAVRGTTNGDVVVFTDDPATVLVDPLAKSTAVLTHVWAAGQTDTEGILRGYATAVWPGGKEQTFEPAERTIERAP